MSNDQPDDAGAPPRTFEFTITPFGTAEGVVIERELAFGLWEIQAGRRLTREIRDVPAFRQAVGDDLLVGFVRLFAAVDRAAAFHLLMALNDRPSPPWSEDRPETAHAPDSISADRNRTTLVVMVWGMFHELSAAVESLKAAHLTPVLQVVSDEAAIAAWKRLRETAGRWQGKFESIARDQLAHHLGDPEVIRAGLAAWPSDKPLIVSTSEHASNAHTRFHIAFDLLCRGTDLATEDFERLVVQGIEDGMRLDSDVMCIFFGALRGRGAPLPPMADLFGEGARQIRAEAKTSEPPSNDRRRAQ